jgi:hypothetical protein
MKNSFCCSLVLTILLAATAFPFSAFSLDLYAMGSYWEQEDTDDGTWGAGAGVSMPLLTEHLRLDGRAYFFENSDLDNDDELELLPVDFGLQIHFLPSATLDPYILGGASYVFADSDRIDVDDDFGAYAGAGLDWGWTSNFKIFGEAVYRSSELDADLGNLNGDLDISGITANAGVKVHF